MRRPNVGYEHSEPRELTVQNFLTGARAQLSKPVALPVHIVRDSDVNERYTQKGWGHSKFNIT